MKRIFFNFFKILWVCSHGDLPNDKIIFGANFFFPFIEATVEIHTCNKFVDEQMLQLMYWVIHVKDIISTIPKYIP